MVTNIIIIVLTWALERTWLSRQETSKMIDYEKIDLIRSGNRICHSCYPLRKFCDQRIGLHAAA